MASVHDVAAYVLQQQGAMTAMKLQKLCYYSHAWHLVWEEQPLFTSPIQAWANGPVIRDLYDRHRGLFSVAEWDGDIAKLSEQERTSIDAVLGFYGPKSAHELSELTHRERPWRDARAGLQTGDRSTTPITDTSMYEYYDGLTTAAHDRS